MTRTQRTPPAGISRLLPLGIALCMLAACGGGGSAASSGAAPANATGSPGSGVSGSVAPSSIAETAAVGGAAPTDTIVVYASGLTAGQEVYVFASYSNGGIASLSGAPAGSNFLITVQFQAPATLGVGVYHGTVTVSECYDQACKSPVANSPQQVSVTYTVLLPGPQLDQLYPTGAAAGGAAFTLQVSGSNFTPQSVVEWNGAPTQTTYVSATQITAQIPAADIALPGAYTVTVANQTAGTAASNSMSFNVAGPSINALSPSSATAYSPEFTLTVNGSNFTPASVVEWRGTALATSYSSPNTLTAQVTTADLANAGSAPVTVLVAAGSQAASSSQYFVVKPLAALAISSLSPAAVYAGGPAFYLTVLGDGFTAASIVQWNGSSRTTTYVSTTELLAQIPPADIASAATASVTVQNPVSQGGTSSPQTFTVAPPLKDAVAFQLNPQHSGAVSFNSVTLPPSSTWTSADLGGTPSYALIADGKVYLTISAPSGNELIALNQSDGAVAWGPIALGGDADNAAYDAGSVFVLDAPSFGSAQIEAYDANSGALQWSTLLTGQYAFSSGPTAADGFVYTDGAGTGGTLYAVPEAGGGIAWTAEVANGQDSAPAVTADGVYVVYPCTTYDFRPATGEPIWYSNTGCEGGGGGSPIAANGVLYSPSGGTGSYVSYGGTQFNAETGATLSSYSADVLPAIGARTGYFLQGGALKAISLSSNTVVWSFAGDGQLTTSPIRVVSPAGGYVFIGSSSGMLYGIDTATGTAAWSVNVGTAFPAGARFDTAIPLSGLAAGDGLLVVPAGTKVIAYRLSTNP